MKIILLCLITCSFALFAKLSEGELPPKVVISGELGGKVPEGEWNSESLRGKVHVLFYVDPDEDKLNKPLEKILDQANFPKKHYQSIGVVNMDATWLPNIAIESKLKSKQNEYPDVIYVRDNEKTLVNSWSLQDNSYDVVAFDKEGKVFFYKDGKVSDREAEKLVKLIQERL